MLTAYQWVVPSGCLLGYARGSNEDQTIRLQLDALRQAGCGRTFSEHASGASSERPVLAEALSHTRRGDTLVVRRLDRLGRSLPHLIEIVQRETDGVGLRSLTEGIDTSTPNGRLIFHLFGALAQFERELIRERTIAGLAAARARGRKGGRPPKRSAEEAAGGSERLLKDPGVDGFLRSRELWASTDRHCIKRCMGQLPRSNGEVGRGLVRAG
ncbi:MAG: recombinase family protein [Rhodospirillales bacterium]|nr:recombinase family protein [Rhodospirillales bacterium]